MTIIPQDDPESNHTPKTVYIYTLCSPLAPDEVRYVGKTNDPQRRLTQHIQDGSDTHKGHWISSLRKQGLIPIMTIIEETTFDIWDTRELYWITYYLEHGYPLTNAYMGSRGPGVISPETKAKMSLAHRGKKQTPDHIAKRMAGAKGRSPSPETRAKLSVSKQGIRRSPESIEKASASRRGRKASPEHIAKISTSLKGRKIPPETIAKMVETKRKNREARIRENPDSISKSKPRKQRDPEVITKGIERMAVANRGKKQSPEHIAKRVAAQKEYKHTAEQHEKIAAKNRGRKQSPETIAKRIATRKANAMKLNPPDAPTLF